MLPAGYMAKVVSDCPPALGAGRVTDVYSVSRCISDDFADYIDYWKHNGYWLFNSPEVIRALAAEEGIDLTGTRLFYYEVHEQELDNDGYWRTFQPEEVFPTAVVCPRERVLEGFDVVTFYAGSAPECSPLSCNGLAATIDTNAHCLLESFAEAKRLLEDGAFRNSEPGPYRIFAVYSVDWN